METKKKGNIFVKYDDFGDKKPNVGGIIGFGIAVILAIIIICNAITIVPTGYTGVKSIWGVVDENNTISGKALKIPFVQNVEQVNNKLQEVTTEGQIWSETSARTAVYYENLAISYKILPEASAWLVANVNDYKNNIITNGVVQSAVKMSSKELPDEQATSRAVIEPIIAQNLQDILDEKFGRQVAVITKVSVANADFDEAYNAAIATKQNLQIEYEQQKINNQKAIEAAEAQKTVDITNANAKAESNKIEAEANAKVKKINAEAEAEAIKITAEAEAEANKEIGESITENYLNYQHTEKWDGKYPSVMTGTDGSTILNIPDTVIE